MVQERGHIGDWPCDPRCRVWEGGHPGDCFNVTPGTMSGRGVTLEIVDM